MREGDLLLLKRSGGELEAAWRDLPSGCSSPTHNVESSLVTPQGSSRRLVSETFRVPVIQHRYARLERADEGTRTADLISLRVILRALRGFARPCKSLISRPVPVPCLAPRCPVLRSRWYQSGIRRALRRLRPRPLRDVVRLARLLLCLPSGSSGCGQYMLLWLFGPVAGRRYCVARSVQQDCTVRLMTRRARRPIMAGCPQRGVRRRPYLSHPLKELSA